MITLWLWADDVWSVTFAFFGLIEAVIAVCTCNVLPAVIGLGMIEFGALWLGYSHALRRRAGGNRARA